MFAIKLKKLVFIIFCILLVLALCSFIWASTKSISTDTHLQEEEKKDFIKWVDFNATYPAMEKAMNLDVKSHNSDGYKYNWIEILAYISAKYAGNFKNYKSKDIDELAEKLKSRQNHERTYGKHDSL